MQPAKSRAREHQVVFCGLEVLRLIGERMESRNDVDGQDLQVVLTFMRDVAHRCLDNTEEILRFACMDQRIANHEKARSLFEQLSRAPASPGPANAIDDDGARRRIQAMQAAIDQTLAGQEKLF